MVEVIMPKMGDAMEEGTLVEWLHKEGDKVKSGDIIGNIQTDKATVELTAPSSGTLSGFLIKPGDTVPVGKAIAAVLKDGDKLPDGWGSGNGAPPATSEEPKTAPAKTEPAPVVTAQRSPPPAPTAPTTTSDRVFASPLARRLASDAGLSIESLHGTGPNGRIVERDVRVALTSQPAKVAALRLPTPALEDRLVPLTNLQRITAERTAHSKSTVPHYYVTIEADVEALENLRKQMNDDNPEQKLSLNDFIIKACAMALVEQPHINASFDNGKRREHGAVHIGVAAAVPDGLTLPVIKDCHVKTVRQIGVEVRALVAKAKDNKLSLDELTGSTFAISNMGMFDVENFSAIINEPNGAILAVSTAKRVPVVVQGDEGEELEVRWRMKATCSFDHRIIDGAVGAQFMGVLRKYLEHPTLLLS